MSNYPINNHKAYHAHVYFDASTLGFATGLCHSAGELFNIRGGTIHQRNVGPHPMWSCQITFGKKDFDRFIPWLDNNRDNLSVLVHALTGNDWDDHTKYAYWLGEEKQLVLSIFEH